MSANWGKEHQCSSTIKDLFALINGSGTVFWTGLIAFHYSMELNLEEIVNIFARQNSRQMVLDLK